MKCYKNRKNLNVPDFVFQHAHLMQKEAYLNEEYIHLEKPILL